MADCILHINIHVNLIIFSFFLEFWVGTGEGLEYFVFKCWNDMHGMHNSQCGTLLYICMYVSFICDSSLGRYRPWPCVHTTNCI